MYSHVDSHLAYKIANANLLEYPYPHMFIENIFPIDIYEEMLINMPIQNNYSPIHVGCSQLIDKQDQRR